MSVLEQLDEVRVRVEPRGINVVLEGFWAIRVGLRLAMLARAEPKFPGSGSRAIHLDLILIDDDNGFVITVPQLPGFAVDGRHRFQAVFNAIDGIRAYLRSLVKHGEPLPFVDEDQLNFNPIVGAQHPGSRTIGSTFWPSPELVGAS